MNFSALRFRALFVTIVLLSAVAGYLLSKASLVGRTGISLFYKEYSFLKTGWKGALLIFVVLSLILGLHAWIQKSGRGTKRMLLHGLVLLAGVIGLLLTYSDFRNTLSHRLLGERFHLGGYLFWVGWLLIGITFLLTPKTPVSNT